MDKLPQQYDFSWLPYYGTSDETLAYYCLGYLCLLVLLACINKKFF